MVPALRFQNLHLGRPWPGTTPSLSEMLSDNETFHGFAKGVEMAAYYRPNAEAVTRHIDPWLDYQQAETNASRLKAKLAEALGLTSHVSDGRALKIGDRVVVNKALDEAGDIQIVVGFPHYSDDDDIVVTVPERGSGRNWTVNRANVMFVGHDLKKALERRAFHLRAKPGYLRAEAFDA